MTSDRKKPGIAFWATVLVVVALVGYPLSFGPACWLVDSGSVSRDLAETLYLPLIALVAQCPDSIQRAMIDYCEFVEPENIEIPSGYYFVTTGRQRYRARFLRSIKELDIEEYRLAIKESELTGCRETCDEAIQKTND